MRYRFTLQERKDERMFVLCFGKDTPTEIEDVIAYADSCTGGEDAHGVRHHVYLKDGKLVSIQLRDAQHLFPHMDPARPETLRMPALHAIMFGNPPTPTLLVQFRQEPPDNRTAYALHPNVFLMFQDRELALLYVFDVYKMIAEVD